MPCGRRPHGAPPTVFLAMPKPGVQHMGLQVMQLVASNSGPTLRASEQVSKCAVGPAQLRKNSFYIVDHSPLLLCLSVAGAGSAPKQAAAADDSASSSSCLGEWERFVWRSRCVLLPFCQAAFLKSPSSLSVSRTLLPGRRRVGNRRTGLRMRGAWTLPPAH